MLKLAFKNRFECVSSAPFGRPVVPEVAVYFNSYLLRGNRAKKKESSQFNAFRSENYPALAEVGVTIDFNFPFILPYRPDRSEERRVGKEC